MNINVTAEHIRRGVANDPDNCMIALAAREATGVAFRVGPSCMYVQNHVEIPAIALPPDVVESRQHFDEGFDVRPFSFEISDDVVVSAQAVTDVQCFEQMERELVL